jgi:hypothetical protein
MAFLALALCLVAPAQAAQAPHNVILLVADGLRSAMVDAMNAPAMAQLKNQGVYFANSHSMFPTFTMPNSSALATGHYLGDTGTFSNTIFSGFSVAAAGNIVTPFVENDAVLGEVDGHFGGDYVNETTILKAARAAGYSTAAIGKVGPALMFDHTERSGESTIVIDDATGSKDGIPLSKAVADALSSAGLPLTAPSRGDNGKTGDFKTPGTTVANTTQQDYFVDAITKAVLPTFKSRNQPFVLVFWSRDPDGSQHNQGDSLGSVTPGINGPTSLAAIKNADRDFVQIMAAIDKLGLTGTTDIFITADHGFGTISKESKTSHSASASYADVTSGQLPPGFLALDIASSLGLPLYDVNNGAAKVAAGTHPKAGNALIGEDPAAPQVIVAANGGSDLIYLPTGDHDLAGKVVAALNAQDYVSGVFVDDALGRYPGTLPMSSIALKGSAKTPMPAMVVNFRTYSTGCKPETNCQVEVADSPLQQGQGMHGTLGRGDTFNFMAALGPDFKQHYVDRAPVSNADVGRTLAKILKLDLGGNGKLTGRVMAEAMPGGKAPRAVKKTLRSQPANGVTMVLQYQEAGGARYFDAAGIPGRTVGLSPAKK